MIEGIKCCIEETEQAAASFLKLIAIADVIDPDVFYVCLHCWSRNWI